MILDQIHTFLERFIAYPTVEHRTAHTLWIAHTHLMDCWDTTPRIAFLSPEPSSGKTRALEITGLLVPNPIEVMNVTPAYLFRRVADRKAGLPTILYDEIDTVFGPKARDNEEIRGLLNAGHRRGAVTGRVVIKGKTITTEEFPAYCAVALAGLGDLPDTLLSRAIVVPMQRRKLTESVAAFRPRVHGPEADKLRTQLQKWCAKSQGALDGTWPELPAGVEDRDADIWEPLIAIADHAGGRWPELARVTSVTLLTLLRDKGGESLGIRLLSDIRTVFDGADGMFTADLLKRLVEIEEAPWGDLKGREIDARGLAWRLSKYGVKPKILRIGEDVARGYARDDLWDVWERYLPPEDTSSPIPPESVKSVTTVTEEKLPLPVTDADSSVTNEGSSVTGREWDLDGVEVF